MYDSEVVSPRGCYFWTGGLAYDTEILLFNLVFHNGVTLVNVSTLKPLLSVIGALPLKP